MPINNMLTVSEAAKTFGVTRQRMHMLIREYSLQTTQLHPRCTLVCKTELKKIPKERPVGIHKNSG